MLKLRTILHPHREGRRELENLADDRIANPAQMGPPPPELTGEFPVVKVRPDKPLTRCQKCNVVSMLPVCNLCTSRGYVAVEVRETVEIEAISTPYDQAKEITEPLPLPVPPVRVVNGWRYPNGTYRSWPDDIA